MQNRTVHHAVHAVLAGARLHTRFGDSYARAETTAAPGTVCRRARIRYHILTEMVWGHVAWISRLVSTSTPIHDHRCNAPSRL